MVLWPFRELRNCVVIYIIRMALTHIIAGTCAFYKANGAI